MFNCLKPKYISFFSWSPTKFFTLACGHRTGNYIKKQRKKKTNNKFLIVHGDVQMSGFGGKRGTEEVCGIIYLEVAKS